MIHVTSRLTAKNRDQLRNPTLGNRVWATFTFLDAYFIVRQAFMWSWIASLLRDLAGSVFENL